MTLRRALLRIYHYPANWLSWFVFAGVGLLLNIVCAPLLLLDDRARHGAAVRNGHPRTCSRRVPRRACAATDLRGVARLHARGIRWPGRLYLESSGPARRAVDPRPPARCDLHLQTRDHAQPSARTGGRNGRIRLRRQRRGPDRDVAERVAAGRSLLIFPEGTRTAPNVDLNAFKPGFALIAARAQSADAPDYHTFARVISFPKAGHGGVPRPSPAESTSPCSVNFRKFRARAPQS